MTNTNNKMRVTRDNHHRRNHTTKTTQQNQQQSSPRFRGIALKLSVYLACCCTIVMLQTVRASIDIAHKKHVDHWSLTGANDFMDEKVANVRLPSHKHHHYNKGDVQVQQVHQLPPPSLAHETTGATIKSSTLQQTIATTASTTTGTGAATDTASLRSRAHHFGQLASLRSKCALAERELDRCSAQLIGLGQTGATYPDNMQELDSVYCPRFRETVACVRNNTDCYKPFERQIINWILTSTRRMNYKRCKSENEKLRFLKLTNSCFATMRTPMDDCMGKYIASLDGIAEYNRDLERLAEDDVQIQLACCANRRFKQCVMKSARQSCQSQDSLSKLRRTNSVSSQRVARKQLLRAVQDSMEDLKSTLDEMALTGPDFVCTGVDEHFCRSKFDGRYSNTGQARHKSIVPAMIKIYANK